MPKKKNEESPEGQFKRFQKAVKDLENAGELNSVQVEEAFEKVIDRLKPNRAVLKDAKVQKR